MRRTLQLAVLVGIASLASIAPARGQVLLGILFGDKLATENFHIGMNVGLGFSNLSGFENSTVNGGFTFGLYGELKLSDHFFFQPELYALSPRGAAGLPPTDSGITDLDEILALGERTRDVKYFEMPLLAKLAIGGGPFRIEAGPSFGLRRSAKDVTSNDLGEEDSVEFEQDISDDLQRFDVAFVFGASFEISKRLSVMARYHLGFSDTVKDNPGEAVKNRHWKFMLGIPIGRKLPAEDEEAG